MEGRGWGQASRVKRLLGHLGVWQGLCGGGQRSSLAPTLKPVCHSGLSPFLPSA